MDLVRFLLDQGANVNGVTTFGSSPFAEAVRTGNAELGLLLAQSGALRHIKAWSWHASQLGIVMKAASAARNVGIIRALYTVAENIRDEWSLHKALEAAIENDQTEMALNFIRRGIRVENDDLHQAISHRNILVARAILNVDDIMFESNGISFMSKATELGNYSLIKDLITAGADVCSFSYEDRVIQTVEPESDSPLAKAAKSGDIEMVKLLLDSGADINQKYTMKHDKYPPKMLMTMTPLEAAVIQGNIAVVRLLIERGADPNNPCALAKAVLEDEELVFLLLEEFGKRYPHGKKFYGSQALKKAIEQGKISMIEAIWRRADTTSLTSADYYDYDYKMELASPFAMAIVKNQGASSVEAQTLLRLGADPNSVVASYFGRLRALEVAIATKSLPMVQLLLKHGADINPPAIKNVRRTPLQKAAETGRYDIVQLLLDRGADVNAAAMRNRGGTALQLAAIKGYLKIAVLLLEAGADVNAPPAACYGRTALEAAAESGRVDMVKLLLEAGVEIEGPGRRYFRRAITLAKMANRYATLEILMSYQRPTTEPVRPQAIFADCEGWTFWAVETDDGFEPWEGDLPADSGEQQEESWEIGSAMIGPDVSQPLASCEGITIEGFLG